MAIELTPRGTRGTELPRLPRPLMDGISAFQVFLFHRMGERMRVQGRPVLLLTTVGAKTGSCARRCSAGSLIATPLGSSQRLRAAQRGTPDGT